MDDVPVKKLEELLAELRSAHLKSTNEMRAGGRVAREGFEQMTHGAFQLHVFLARLAVSLQNLVDVLKKEEGNQEKS